MKEAAVRKVEPPNVLTVGFRRVLFVVNRADNHALPVVGIIFLKKTNDHFADVGQVVEIIFRRVGSEHGEFGTDNVIFVVEGDSCGVPLRVGDGHDPAPEQIFHFNHRKNYSKKNNLAQEVFQSFNKTVSRNLLNQERN